MVIKKSNKWIDVMVDESKYNDYIIYNTKRGENEEDAGDFDPI